MALERQGARQADLILSWAELPRSPGHAFYDRLQAVLIEAGFDGFAEQQCAPYYASRRGRPSLPPGRYFRMHLVGYFEGIDSERGLEWRCADSLLLREFLRLGRRCDREAVRFGHIASAPPRSALASWERGGIGGAHEAAVVDGGAHFAVGVVGG